MILSIEVNVKNQAKIDEILSSYNDVNGHWAESEIAWAITNKIIQGYENKTFRPESGITEAELMTFIFRALKFDNTDVKSQSLGHWSDEVYGLSNKYNIPLDGYQDAAKRDSRITRKKAAEIIVAVDGLKLQDTRAISYMLARSFSDGKTVEGYRGEDYLTRAEAIKLIFNLREKGVQEVKKAM